MRGHIDHLETYLAFPLPLDLRLEAGGVESSSDNMLLMEVSLSVEILPDRLLQRFSNLQCHIERIVTTYLFLPPFFLGSSIASSSSSSGVTWSKNSNSS